MKQHSREITYPFDGAVIRHMESLVARVNAGEKWLIIGGNMVYIAYPPILRHP